ncbi:hypothetical protein PHLGIDRAFT_331622 [Phlebiopsis gigantea 11061_1 CR5-6]|uniref:N-acetyltransferase domain-containing protein n=1 Tax=Phlebiopsis gigantea (strain 11061_1 CR5-6) TaxID=745531 RepID=A0A0C3S7D7_PHLG1|nr:hypothetical protein PHLGIDRAFT_331622 [Phlebiopsis gigantea 11061_1 CR5-6]
MSNLHLVQFRTPQEFLQAVEAHDDAFLNWSVGSLLESTDQVQIKMRKLKGIPKILLAVYENDALILVMIKVAEDIACSLAAPRDTIVELSGTEMAAAVSLLVTHVASIVDPKIFDKIMAPDDLGDLFIKQWIAQMETRGLRFEPLPHPFEMKVSYATLATIPPPPPIPLQYELELPTHGDVEVLAQFFVDFARHGPREVSLEEARDKMRMHVDQGDIWVCKVDGEIAGFCVTGRSTAKTIAIRNVYVSPRHRRKGIADSMTRILTRYLLGATPLGSVGGPAASSPKSVKLEVVLNVAQDFVERIYKNCGFLLGTDDKDPVSGKKGWQALVFRGVRLLESESAAAA